LLGEKVRSSLSKASMVFSALAIMGTPLRVKVEVIHSILTKNKELWKQIKSNLVGNLKLLFYSLYNLQYKTIMINAVITE
jgi:hypothetical protein